MKNTTRPRCPGAFKSIVVTVVLCVSLKANAQFAIAGLAFGQEIKSCPAPSVPIRKDACDSGGIACRFPHNAATVFGTSAKHLSFATDSFGRVESLVAWGFDAGRAVAEASEQYGAPDVTETRKKMTYSGWIRGDVRLTIFHNAEDDDTSSVILDRPPQGVVLPCKPKDRDQQAPADARLE